MTEPAPDGPVTGRRMLTESAYADDRNLRVRMAIWAYATGPAHPSWRLRPVRWDGTQRVVDVGCGNGLDLRQLLARGWCGQVVGLDLSPGMLAGRGPPRTRAGRAWSTPTRSDCRWPLTAPVGLAMHMLYHVPDIPAAVSELRRVVQGGRDAARVRE